MFLVLATLAGCWRPEPYTPPPPPFAAEGDASAEGGSEPPTGGGASDEEDTRALAPGEDPEDIPSEDAPTFARYTARTVQGPVTIVDDWGKNLVVIGEAGVLLEVRGEESFRMRVRCETCDPPVEGWLQPHLLERVP